MFQRCLSTPFPRWLLVRNNLHVSKPSAKKQKHPEHLKDYSIRFTMCQLSDRNLSFHPILQTRFARPRYLKW